jgi:hypothetical protein
MHKLLAIAAAIIAVEASAAQVWVNADNARISRPDRIGQTINPTDGQLATHGIRAVAAPDNVDERFWVWDGDGFSALPQAEIDAILAADAQAAIDAEQARVAALAQSYGGIVAALRHYLVVVGWDIPCDAAQVTADLMARSIADTLTDDQVRAQGNIADLYILLQGQSVSNADIAAIWEAIQ